MDGTSHIFFTDTFWVLLGMFGQAVLSLRYIARGLVEDAEGQVEAPTGFWLLSLLGAAILLAYAVHKMDPVFIVGQAMAIGIYAYSLHQLTRTRSRTDAATRGA